MYRNTVIKILNSIKDRLLDIVIKKVFFENDSVEVKYLEEDEDLLELYYSFRPDIIIINSDQRRDVLEIINYIRDQANDSDVYILVILEESEWTLKEEILKQGADDFLIKPIFYGEEEIMARLSVAKRHVILYRQLLIAYNRLSKEIDTVSTLQQKLLPREGLDFPGLFVDFFYQPSGRASGDYFDFFPLNENVLRAVIADVSGHGSRAAFIMSMVRALIRASDVTSLSLNEVVSLINSELIEVIGEDIDFVTLFIGDVDVKNKKLSYINAGHCPGILVGLDNELELLGADHSVLGFFPQEFEVKRTSIENYKGLFLFTDGYYEWNLDRDNIWGFDNFKKLLKEIFKKEKEFYLDLLEFYLERCLELPPMYRDDRSSLWLKFKFRNL